MRQLQRIYQHINLGTCVVHSERGAAGGVQPQMRHQRPGAALACTHRDPLLVEDGRYVVRMRRALHRERKNRGFVRHGSLHCDPI
jgi:hypothetical protein